MTVVDFVEQQIPAGWRKTPSGWISGNCPMCVTRGHRADERRRGGFHFDSDKFQYNCFNCGFKTGWSPGRNINSRLEELLIEIGADPVQIQRIKLELMKEQQEQDIAKQFISKDHINDKVIIKWKASALPPNSKRIDKVDTNSLKSEDFQNYVDAVEYIYDRKLDFYSDWYWTDCNEKPFKNFSKRIILPFVYKGDIVGYTARWIGDPPNKQTPKYFLESPSNFVFNLDAQSDKKTVIVTEGQLDALVTGGVAVNGATPGDIQLSIIDQLNKEIIVLPDADSASMPMVRAAIKRGWKVSFPDWTDCKDAGDAIKKYGRLFTVRSILESAESSKTKIEIMAKSYCK